MNQKISKRIQNGLKELNNQLGSLAAALRKLDDSYRSMQNSYMTTVLQFFQLKALVDYTAADAGKEAGDEQ